MKFRVEIEQEEDGRWIAEVVDLPGVLAYGSTSEEAQAKVQAIALRVVADRLEHGEAGSDLVSISLPPNEPVVEHACQTCFAALRMAGSSSANPVLTEHFPVPAGRILCLPSMKMRRLVLGCLPKLQNRQGSIQKICRS